MCDNPALAGAPFTPPPVPVAPPPPEASAEPPRTAAPVTTPRSLWEDAPAKPKPSQSLVPVEKPAAPAPVAPPEPTGPRTTALAVIGAGRVRRRKVDVYVFEGALGIVKAGSADRRRQAMHLTRGQVSALDPDAEFIDTNRVKEIDVAESPLGGQMTVVERDGSSRLISWSRRPNRGLDVERTLHEAFPGKVDIATPRLPPGLVRVLAVIVAVVVFLIALRVGLGFVFKEDEPPPPPPPTTTTLSPQEQQIQAEMAQACPAWRQLFGSLGPGARPDPAALRAVTASMRPRIEAAVAADAAYTPARDELAFLEALAGKPPEELARESAARIDFAADKVTAACDSAKA